MNKNEEKYKVWFCGMSGPKSIDDLKELLEPIYRYLHGVVWTLHDSINSPEEEYLNSVKKNGKILHSYYCRRHDNSRNQYLWCGPIKKGDWIITCDLLERININFVFQLPQLIKYLKGENINTAYFHGKPILFEWDDSLVYRGTPHESLVRQNGTERAVDLKDFNFEESQVRLNIRPFKRDKFHFVNHYLKYYMDFPYGSNHCLLGLEKNGDPSKLFPEREKRRLDFKNYCEKIGIYNHIDLIASLCPPISHSEEFKDFFRKEKILNDVWRYYVLKDKNFNDDHDFKNIVEIEYLK